jgi:hypothetical protein
MEMCPCVGALYERLEAPAARTDALGDSEDRRAHAGNWHARKEGVVDLCGTQPVRVAS